MAYEIVYSRAVRTQLQRLPGHMKPLAKQAIADLSENPRPPQSKEFVGHPNHYRVWLGAHYRLVWHVIDEIQVVEIDYIGPQNAGLISLSWAGSTKQLTRRVAQSWIVDCGR